MRGSVWRVAHEQIRPVTQEESQGAELVNKYLAGMRAELARSRGARKFVDVAREGSPRFPRGPDDDPDEETDEVADEGVNVHGANVVQTGSLLTKRHRAYTSPVGAGNGSESAYGEGVDAESVCGSPPGEDQSLLAGAWWS